MKALAWILTAATILVGADIFVASSDSAEMTATDSKTYTSGFGESGSPPPPPDATELK